MTTGTTCMTPEQVRQHLIARDVEHWKSRLDNQPHHPIEVAVAVPTPASMVDPTTDRRCPPSTVYLLSSPSHDAAVAAAEADPVHRPAHYTEGGIETIDFIRAKLGDDQFMGYCVGNALKYLSRAGKKGALTQDLEKAKVYLGWAIEVSLGKEITK